MAADVEERPIADQIDGIAHPADSLSVTGHDTALNLLNQSLRSGKMHHAWLFSGPRGIGKASLAHVFSKYLLSLDAAQSIPEIFDPAMISNNVHRQVQNGGHPELLHLTRPWDEKTKKFKTQLSVDEVRKTLPFYGMTAGAGGWRITIVDAADDMNASAANALLKILEEPPKRSLFFILSHSTGRLLTTIKSRCQSLRLDPLDAHQLDTVLSSLGVQASDQDKKRAISLGNGSVRRTIQLIESSVLQEFDAFEKLMTNKAKGHASDWSIVHKISDSISKKGQEESYDLFLDLTTTWIGNQVRQNLDAPLSSLAAWSEVWDKANRSSHLADAFNLDKKQVILSLFGDLFDRNKRN